MKYYFRNFILLFFIAFTSKVTSFSQDLILKKNGDEIKSKVVEVLKTEIKYKKHENLSGPIYSIDLSEVFMVRYENGSKDVFNVISNPGGNIIESFGSRQEAAKNDLKNSPSSVDIGRLVSVGGKYVFINSVPIAKYEVVFTFSNLMDFQDLANPTKTKEKSLNNANIEAANQGRIYDAVICQLGVERDMAIRFTDPSEEKSFCRVSKINGVLAFVGCEPVMSYTTTGIFYSVHESGTNSLFGNYQASYDFFCNKAIDWGRKKRLDFDAIIYHNSLKGNDLLVKF